MRALVTGATGFVGGALARRLHTLGWQVTGLGRNPAAGAQLTAAGIAFVRADLADQAAVVAACAGQEVVFHCGARSTPWGRPAAFESANIAGTAHVLAGCRAHGVGRLVHVSTPSLYFGLTGPTASRLNVAEDAPLPNRPANHYVRTKLAAERLVDAAHQTGLPVITLRPRAIFGPGDTAILPRLLDRLRSGQLAVIGDGETLTDLTYIDNVVDALLAAAAAPASALGRKYNITNGEPVRLWAMVGQVCGALGLPYPRRRIPFGAAYALAWTLERLCAALPGYPEPPLTRYTVGVLAHSATLDITAARRDLGYAPRVSVAEGVARYLATLSGRVG